MIIASPQIRKAVKIDLWMDWFKGVKILREDGDCFPADCPMGVDFWGPWGNEPLDWVGNGEKGLGWLGGIAPILIGWSWWRETGEIQGRWVD